MFGFDGQYVQADASAQGRREALAQLRRAFDQAEAVVVGAGAGLSTAAGMTYGGKRFDELFADFKEKYGFRDMYSGGFGPFESLEEQWAFWSRSILCNRYTKAPGTAYDDLRAALGGKEYFVITTNVDHQFQLAGFDKDRLFYTQGDYGLWQCSVPCHDATYDNEDVVRRMVAQQKDMKVPSQLVSYCPRCGKPMAMNLRADDTFVEDAGWHAAQERYSRFVHSHERERVLYLELGVGYNTPVIIKFPFWQLTDRNPQAVYACVNQGDCLAPSRIADRSILVDGDLAQVVAELRDAR
ncbi:MAG: SIR2 family NAD-dependent protein deacylase [Eggerthellaceae bacterium]|jgi:NAD-dependent SIR2 family protein deacetylase